jgi:hypothetical protein
VTAGVRQTLEVDNGVVALTILLSLVTVFAVNQWVLYPLIESVF